MKLSGVRPSVRPSVCLSVRFITHPPHAAAVGLLLSAAPAADINRRQRPPHAQQLQRRSTAHSSKLRSVANASNVTLTADVGS